MKKLTTNYQMGFGIKAILVATMTMLFATQVFAGQATPTTTISKVITNIANQVKVNTSSAVINPDGCQATNFYLLDLDETFASQRLYSALMTANATKQKVGFWIHGCVSMSGKTYPKIHAIYSY